MVTGRWRDCGKLRRGAGGLPRTMNTPLIQSLRAVAAIALFPLLGLTSSAAVPTTGLVGAYMLGPRIGRQRSVDG